MASGLDGITQGTLAPAFAKPARDRRPLGRILVDMGRLTELALHRALDQQRRLDARLGDILIYDRHITALDLREALAQQHGLTMVDLDARPPDPAAAGVFSPEFCLRHNVVPWRQLGDLLLVATTRPDLFDDVRAGAGEEGRVLIPLLCEGNDIRAAQQKLYGPALAARAERRVPPPLSARTLAVSPLRRIIVGLACLLLLLVGGFSMPAQVWVLLSWAAVISLGLSVGLKAAATLAEIHHRVEIAGEADSAVTPLRLPQVSVLVPLLNEKYIAEALVRRLARLSYPKALLDVILVLEEHDSVTRETLAKTTLPPWMRVIEVPGGSGLTTKPRALNYALDFCRGSIVGIWDAEDAPQSDQIEQVVQRFHAAPRDVVCLQGRLDYYNARANWIARCFTIEYAAWWRLVMPGLARLGLVIPLGGTTLFFRRKELETLGGWDAHNVTEDADLGMRLARAGYRTELIASTTFEEANCRAWPWIRQRSRWLKGFAMTWAVHMRDPVRLWRDLGPYRFLGFQIFFLAALSQFLFAPIYWSFWFILLGYDHPFADATTAFWLIGFFLAAEVLTLAIHLLALRRPHHWHLAPWTLAMTFYYVMGCIAVYKALYELVMDPFFWAKTEHGVSDKDPDPDPIPAASRPGRWAA